MLSGYNHKIFAASSLLVLIVLLGTATSKAQSKQLYIWLEDLTYLQNASSTRLAERRAEVAQIYSGIEVWLKLHAESNVSLPAAPPKPWNAEQVQEMVAGMHETVQSLLEQDSGRAFELGPMEITVTADTSPLLNLFIYSGDTVCG